MKRSLTSIMTYIFLFFLLVCAICIVQNIVKDVQKSLFSNKSQGHILDYRKA